MAVCVSQEQQIGRAVKCWRMVREPLIDKKNIGAPVLIEVADQNFVDDCSHGNRPIDYLARSVDECSVALLQKYSYWKLWPLSEKGRRNDDVHEAIAIEIGKGVAPGRVVRKVGIRREKRIRDRLQDRHRNCRLAGRQAIIDSC